MNRGASELLSLKSPVNVPHRSLEKEAEAPGEDEDSEGQDAGAEPHSSRG